MVLPALVDGWRIAFLLVEAPVVGAVLLLAIGTVTGARWEPVARLIPLLSIVLVGAAVLGLAQSITPTPPHFSLWLHPLAVAMRGASAVGLLLWAVRRPLEGRSGTVAAVLLAGYAVLVTPIAFDWLLGGVPGQPVSAAGMMLAVRQVAGATALLLVLGWGDVAFRRDMAKLMVAAALGLGYLHFMDYLIVWFGNLPDRVGFYVDRSHGVAGRLPPLALLLGWAVPIGLLAAGRAQRWAGGSTLAALFVTDCWWVGGGIVAALLAAMSIAAVALAARMLLQREALHG